MTGLRALQDAQITLKGRVEAKGRLSSLASAVLSSSKLVALALGLAILAVLLALFGRNGYDDPYITFRYAQNLLAGNGFVYNVGQRTLCTTAALYGLLLAGLGLVWHDLPSVANALSAVSLVLAATLLFLQADAHGETAVGLVAGLFLVLAPLAVMTFGSESCLYVASILAGLYAYDRSRLEVAAVVLAAAAMIRPDGILAAATLAGCHLVARRAIPWRAAVLYLALTGAWFGGLWIYYGSPVPVTLLVKQQQGLMSISPGFLERFVSMAQGYLRLPFTWAHAALALVGLVRVARQARHWLPLLAWTAAYFLAYTLLGVSSYFWYYAPLLPSWVVLVAEGLHALARLFVRARVPKGLVLAGTGLLIVALLSPLLVGTLQAAWMPDSRPALYRDVGEWLDANTNRNAAVGALEVGVVGYYAGRTMVDFAGLIHAKVAHQLGKATTYAEPTAWAVQTLAPDYVVLHREAFASVAESSWFAANYEAVRDFAKGQELWVTVYRRNEGH